jgi:hypothetical protein
MIKVSDTVRVEKGPSIKLKKCTQKDYNRAPANNKVDAKGKPLVIGKMMSRLANAHGEQRWKVYKWDGTLWDLRNEFESEAEALDYAESL